MFSINAISWAFFGLNQNLQRFENAANRISDPDTAAGIDEIMEMKQAERGIKVNAAVIKTANEMSDHVVDMLV